MVSATPRIDSSGLNAARIRSTVWSSWLKPLEREELGLQRHQQVARRDQGVDGQQAKRGRAVDQADVPAPRRQRRQRLVEPVRAIVEPDQLDLGARQVDRRRQQVEPRHARRHRRFDAPTRCRSARRSSSGLRCDGETPRPVEALPCGSRSISSTRQPIAASAVARLIAVVVLPTPPFWFATAIRIMFASPSPLCRRQSRTSASVTLRST